MLILNYYYNDYDEIDVNDLNNGTDTSGDNVAVIVGATIGSVFSFYCLLGLIIIFCGPNNGEV